MSEATTYAALLVFDRSKPLPAFLADCKYYATKVQLTLAEDYFLDSPGEPQLSTRITFYNDQNVPCHTGIAVHGDPYNLPRQPDGDYHQTYPLGSQPQSGARAAAVADDPITAMLFTYDGDNALELTGLPPISASDFLNNILLPTNLEQTYQRVVALLDDATTVTGSAQADAIEVGAGNDAVTAGAGDDIVYKWKAGNLTFNGEGGTDTLSFNTANYSSFPTAPTQQLVVDLGAGTGKNPYGGTLSLTGIENVIGTPQADVITGSDAANIIGDGTFETAGDVIDAKGGNDTIGFFSFAAFFPDLPGAEIDGGTGTDTLLMQYDRGGNVLDLANQAANAGMFRGSTFANIERFVVGGDFNTSFGDLTFRGDGAANSLSVRQGALTINLRGGDDTLELTAVATSDPVSADGGTGSDRLVFAPRFGVSVLDLTTPANNTGPFANATFAGFERFEMAPLVAGQNAADYRLDFRGNGEADAVTAGGGADTLAGNGGDDILEGGGGADALKGGAGNDTASYTNAKIGVTASLAKPSTNSGDAAGDSFSLIENLGGSRFGDALTGDGLANILDGRLGADKMTGGLGNDIYYVDDAGDTVTELAGTGSGTDIVRTTLNTYVLSANVERAVFQGEGAFTVTGNASDNKLTGGTGDDKFFTEGHTASLPGSDVFGGGTGTDAVFYTKATIGAVINLQSGTNGGSAANDVYGSIEKFFGSNTAMDTMTASNAGRATFSGQGGNDVLTGGATVDQLFGGAGNDTLTGKGGIDQLAGGLGNDIMDGGAGRDLFVFVEAKFGVDTINNYEDGQDRLKVFSAVANDISDFTITGNDTTTVTLKLAADPTNVITIKAASAIHIDANDFLFY